MSSSTHNHARHRTHVYCLRIHDVYCLRIHDRCVKPRTKFNLLRLCIRAWGLKWPLRRPASKSLAGPDCSFSRSKADKLAKSLECVSLWVSCLLPSLSGATPCHHASTLHHEQFTPVSSPSICLYLSMSVSLILSPLFL